MSNFRKPKLALDDVQGMVAEALSLHETLKKAAEKCLEGAASLNKVSKFQAYK